MTAVTVHVKAQFPMKIGANHLSYCTNVHPAETFEELIQTLRANVSDVKQNISSNDPFGVGLRLSAQMVLSMNETRKQMLIETLISQDMYVFSVNGFPYGDFGIGVVKTAVYEPGWDDQKRVTYTKAIADLLVELPGGPSRSISTVALGNATTFTDTDRVDLAINNLKEVCAYLHQLHQNTGVFIQLCLEPEPATFLETTDDVLSFFVGHGFTDPNPVNAHLAVCYDTCHQAVMFESAQGALQALHEAGIRIGKMQISNAIVLDDPQSESQRGVLMQFDEARFLHQVVADDGALFALDLPELRAPSTEWLSAQEWRCHFHVPLHWTGSNGLSTTDRDWKSALQYALDNELCTHFEIETYTWGVLPNGAGGTHDVSQGICEEFRVVMPFFLESSS